MLRTLLFLLVLSFGSFAHASVYVEGCIKSYEFHLSDTNDKVKDFLNKMCGCQEKELVKKGITQKEMEDFVSGAGTPKITNESAAVAPKINGIINSEEIKTVCGSLF